MIPVKAALTPELDRSRLSPQAQRTLAARDALLTTLGTLSTAEAMLALQYTVASWVRHIVACDRHSDIDVAIAFANRVLTNVRDPDAHFVAPIRRN